MPDLSQRTLAHVMKVLESLTPEDADTPLDHTPEQAIAGETQLGPCSFFSNVEAWTESFSGLLDRRTTWLLAALLLLYIAATVPLACLKFMWLDELFTYSIAGLPNANRIWLALASRGVAPMPPTFYFVTRFTQNLLGPSHFAIRLPELAGFWMASLCLFHYVRRRTGALYGLVGVMALWITGAYRYAYEARPYGLVLGFCGLALVCWQAAPERVHRRRALLGLFGALAGAVFSHYGGVMLLFPLGLGELVRSISRRKVDWPVWLSFCGALVPLLLFLPLLGGSISAYGVAMWSRPTLKSVPSCYGQLLSSAARPLAAVFVTVTLWRLLLAVRTDSSAISADTSSRNCGCDWIVSVPVGLSAPGPSGYAPDHTALRDSPGHGIRHPVRLRHLSKLQRRRR